MKDVIWLADSKDVLLAFPQEEIRKMGIELMVVQLCKEAIYVISSFHKHGQKTPKKEKELAAKRYQQLITDRRKGQ